MNEEQPTPILGADAKLVVDGKTIDSLPENIVHIPQIDPDDFTRYDEALADQLSAMAKAGSLPKMLDVFKKFAPKLTDRAYWYLLGALWNRYPAVDRLTDWLELFSAPRPNRALYLMHDYEQEVAASIAASDLELIETFRPMCKTNGLNPFSYCVEKKTADHHARVFGAETVGRFLVPRASVVAYFQRTRGGELLVIDPRGITREGELPLDPMKKSRRKRL